MATIATNAELARVGIQELVPVYTKNERKYYSGIGFREIKETQEYWRAYQEGGFGQAAIVNEETQIPIDTFTNPYTKDYYWVKRGLGYSASFEKLETDQYGVMDRIAPKMAYAMVATEELTAANVFNQHTNTASAYLGPDAKPLVSTSHPYLGGTMSNRGVNSTNDDVDLSAVTLELAVQKLMDQVDYRGLPVPCGGPFTLLVATANAGLAHRLAESQMLPQSANNDKNWAGGMVSSVVANPYLTDGDAWWLVAQNKDKHGLIVVRHGGRRVSKEEVAGSEKYNYYMTQKWLFHFVDHRGVWGSPGA